MAQAKEPMNLVVLREVGYPSVMKSFGGGLFNISTGNLMPPPNPSLKRSANGMPPLGTISFLPSGGMPSSPA